MPQYVHGGNGSTTGYWGVTAWSAGASVSTSANGGRGTYRRQTAPAYKSERVFRLTTNCAGGVTGGTEPSWNTARHGTTADNSGVWTECTGDEADMGTGGTWTAPHANLYNGLAWTSDSSTVDTIYIHSSHAPTGLAAINGWAGSFSFDHPYKIICVNGSHVPPLTGDITTGASETYTGFQTIDSVLMGYIKGFKFILNDIGTTSPIRWNNGSAGGGVFFEDGGVTVLGTQNQPFLDLYTGSNGASATWWFKNFTLNYPANASQGTGILCGVAKLRFTNLIIAGTPKSTASVITGGSNITPGAFHDILIEDSDLSLIQNYIFVAAGDGIGKYVLKRCKLHSSVAIVGNPPTRDTICYDVVQCDSGGSTLRNERYMKNGTKTTVTNPVRTGGATDGTTQYAWKVVTTASNWWFNPFETFPIAKWNTTVGSTVSVTWYGITNAAAIPTNADIWGSLDYMGTSGSPLGSVVEQTAADFLSTGTNLTADTSAWDTAATARANSHAYAVGDIIKVASNPGRIFFCTASGTSAGSEPGGYASAVDGGSVTDSGATFRAGVRFSQTITVTPQNAGYLQLTIKAAKVSATFYIDPSF